MSLESASLLTLPHPQSALFYHSNQVIGNNKELVNRDYALHNLATLKRDDLLGTNLKVKERMNVAFTLFHLSRTKAGAREIVNCLRMCKSTEKPGILYQSGNLFQSIGDLQSAYACFNEASIQANVLKDVPISTISTIQRSLDYLVSIGAATSTSVPEKRSRDLSPSIDSSNSSNSSNEILNEKRIKLELENLQEMIQLCVNPEQFAFAKQKLNLYKCTKDLENMVSSFPFKNSQLLGQEKVINNLIQNLIHFPTFNLLFKTIYSPRLWDLLKSLKLQAEIDGFKIKLPKDYPDLLEQMKQVYHLRNNGGLSRYMDIVDIEMKTCLMYALKEYMNGDYQASIQLFNDVINCCFALRKLSTIKEKSRDLPKELRHTEKFLFKQLSKCQREKLQFTACTLGSCAGYYGSVCYFQVYPNYRFADEDEYIYGIPILTQLSNILSDSVTLGKSLSLSGLNLNYGDIYLTLGKIQERFAFFESHYVSACFDDYSNASPSSSLLSLNESRLEAAISYFAKSVQEKNSDDPVIVKIYDETLLCILLHGKIHLQTFWVLKFLRDLAYLQSDCSTISYEDDCILKDNDLNMGELVGDDFLSIMEKVYRIREMCQDRKGSIFITSTNKYLLSKFVYNSDFKLVECPVNSSTVRSSSTNNDKLIKSVLKLTPKHVQKCNEMSEGILEHWLPMFEKLAGNNTASKFIGTYYDGKVLCII